MEKIASKGGIDWPITIVSIAAVFVFVAFMAIKPDATLAVVGTVFDYTTMIVGVPILWFVFLGLIFCLYLAFSRHGRVKLGEGETEFSLYSYISMMICACLASTAVFYSFVEWSYYLADPAFGIEPFSQEAAEYSMAYAFFHWGLQCSGNIRIDRSCNVLCNLCPEGSVTQGKCGM